MHLAERYQYREKHIVVPTTEALNDAIPHPLRAHRTYLDAQFAVYGMPITYDCIILPWGKNIMIALTALAGDHFEPIGFFDLALDTMTHISDGIGCFGARREQLPASLRHPSSRSELYDGIPFRELRFPQDDHDGGHSFRVVDDYQGLGVGRNSLFTGLELSVRLGGSQHAIAPYNDGTKDFRAAVPGYYDQFTTRPDFLRSAIIFTLSDE